MMGWVSFRAAPAIPEASASSTCAHAFAISTARSYSRANRATARPFAPRSPSALRNREAQSADEDQLQESRAAALEQDEAAAEPCADAEFADDGVAAQEDVLAGDESLDHPAPLAPNREQHSCQQRRRFA